MSINYAKKLPRDSGNEPMQDFPPNVLAVQRYASENASVSSVITLSDNTSSIEVAAVGGPAVVKWIAQGNTNPSVFSAVATANYDHVVPANLVRKFVVPIERQGVSSIVGINVQAGLYNRVAVKSIGVASVLTSEY